VKRQGNCKHGAQFMTAMAGAMCANIQVITAAPRRDVFAYAGRAFKPNATLMWPSAHAALMGPEQAATTCQGATTFMSGKESWTDEEREALSSRCAGIRGGSPILQLRPQSVVRHGDRSVRDPRGDGPAA